MNGPTYMVIQEKEVFEVEGNGYATLTVIFAAEVTIRWIVIDLGLGNSGQHLLFGRDVLDHFARHRQSMGSPNEAGGQLFSFFEDGVIRVALATGPRLTDKRGPLSYAPDRCAERVEIKANFEKECQ